MVSAMGKVPEISALFWSAVEPDMLQKVERIAAVIAANLSAKRFSGSADDGS